MKIALVTGVSSGLGRSITLLLLENNWKVYGVSRNNPKITNENLVWLKTDLQSPTEIDSISKSITEDSIDLLVSNAGIAFEELATNISTQSFKKMFDINVLAPMLVVNNVKNKVISSTIISISSVSDRLVDKYYALYCSSKSANTRYFESLSKELNSARVYSLLPDYIDTPMLRKLQEGRDFSWDEALNTNDIAKLCINLESEKINPPSGSNIIIINDLLKEDLESEEKLFGYNTDTMRLTKLL